MNVGIIKWFDANKGYGVICTNEENIRLISSSNVTSTEVTNEVFLHIKNWKDRVDIDINNGQPVIFNSVYDHNKTNAVNCSYFKCTSENLDLILQFVGNNECIKIKDRHSDRECNFIESAFLTLKTDIDERALILSLQKIALTLTLSELENKCRTIFEVRKQTSNQKLKEAIDKAFVHHFSSIDFDDKIRLWEKDFIPATAFTNRDFITHANYFQIDDLKSMTQQLANEEVLHIVISKKINLLKEDFSFRAFCEIKKWIDIIDNESFRIKTIQNINELAESRLVNEVCSQLAESKKLNDTLDFDALENIFVELPNFLNEDIVSKIQQAIEYYISDSASISDIIRAFKCNFLSNPDSVILMRSQDLSLNELNEIINNKIYFHDDFIEILFDKLLIDSSKHSIILSSIRLLHDIELFKQYDKKIYETSIDSDYFELWTKGLGKIIPFQYLSFYFDDKSDKYQNIESWINKGYIALSQIAEILVEKLNSFEKITDRIQFQTIYNIIEYLIEKDSEFISIIKNKKNQYQLLILWYLGLYNELDYNLLKGKFIYFRPKQQVRIVKKLFQLKMKGDLDLSIGKLDQLVRADLDLYLTNEKFNSDIVLDLSTSVVVECLKRFSQNGKFLVSSDLLSIVLREIGQDKTRKFQLSEYFDNCEGRMVAKYNWRRNGEIKKEYFGDNQFYYAISFGENNDRYNSRIDYDSDFQRFQFDELKGAVKKLSGRKWNPVKEHWGVPSKYENEVIEFAKTYRFFLDFGGNVYKNNAHLVEYKRDSIPAGIKFCEGNKALKFDETFHKDFWWCANQKCFENIEIYHTEQDWEKFTILDFIKILGLSVVETGKYGTFEIGLYNQFISQVNRFNQLLDKIYCRECNHILYPVEIGNFTAHSVVKFSCENKNCTEHGKVIYLNHCLNGKCNSIIDSRDSRKCPNGLYICNNCGSCCSHTMFARRLNNLSDTGGRIYEELVSKVDNKEGHLERAEYYCYNCGEKMAEISREVFKCSKCDVTYETEKYKFNREYRHLRSNDSIDLFQ